MSFNQGIPGPATLINSSSTLLYGNSASANALSVQQLGAGNVASFRTTTGSTALFVSSAGNVGVGTNSQFANGFGSGLMVNSGTINGSNAFNMVLLSNATTVNYTQVGQIGFGIGGDMPSFSIQSQAVNRDNGAGPYYDYGAQSDLRFLYKTFNSWPAGGVNEAMRIKGTNGYVGIGTANPTYALDVNGGYSSYLQYGGVRAPSYTSASYTTGTISNGANGTYTPNILGNYGGIFYFTVIASDNGSMFSSGIAYNWNPNLQSLSVLLTAGGVAVDGPAGVLRITNNTGAARSFVISILNTKP